MASRRVDQPTEPHDGRLYAALLPQFVPAGASPLVFGVLPVGRAARASDKAKLKRAYGQARHAGVLSRAMEVLFEAESWGEAVPLGVVWDAIEATVGSRARLRMAMEAVREFIPPADAVRTASGGPRSWSASPRSADSSAWSAR